MPNGLQMWPNVITGPLCVNTQRALKCINPTDMFSSPTTPASNQITHKGSSSISLAPHCRWALPGDSWKTTHSSPLSSKIKVLFHKHNDVHRNGHFPKHTGADRSLWRLPCWDTGNETITGDQTKEPDRTLAWYQAVSKLQSCYPFVRVVTLQATNTVATYTEASKRAIMFLNIYDKTMRKVFISYKTMRIFCFNLNR